MKKTVTLLGSTGSVGRSALSVIENHPGSFEVAGLAACSNADGVAEQVEKFKPRAVYLHHSAGASALQKRFGSKLKVFTQADTLRAFSSWVDADILLAASSGTTSLEAVMDALEKGKKVALSNKEILVMAGEMVMKAAKKGVLIPVDSEHSAIFQCLVGHSSKYVSRIILTGSGGPLREVSKDRFGHLSKEEVTRHPKWKMGQKITVDSATMMNKGLEIIEASWLFGVPLEKIEVWIHPQAIVHSMVEFEDGVMLAQLGVTDMRLPIQAALTFPERLPAPELKLKISDLSQLSFSLPDKEKFPCLGLATAAARQAGSAPCVLSAADEVAVGAYLEDRISFVEIPAVIEKVLSNHRHVPSPGLSEIQSIYDWATEETKKLCYANF